MSQESRFANAAVKASLAVLFLLSLSTKPATAQVQTGTPKYESFGGGPFDSVNLGDLNVHFSIPVLHKPGRGMPFNFDITYDSTFWQPTSVGWQPSPTSGFGGNAMDLGALLYSYGYFNCLYNGSSYPCLVYYSFDYTDGFGTSHPFSGAAEWLYTIGVDLPLQNAAAFDGSGYVLGWDASSGAFSLYSNDGSLLVPAGTLFGTGSPASVVDRNGNIISESSTATLTDTLGVQVLTQTGGNPTQTGGAAYVATYTDPNGHAATVTLSWTSYTVQTNFGCAGITDYPATSGYYLPNRITLPNGTYYQFTYEATPGHTGNVTGRLASVQLPTGGTISYAYTGSNNGINCADGTAMGLTRQTPDGTWSYTRTLGTQGITTTTIADPASNHSVIQFASGVGLFFEQQRQVYQGSISPANLLETVTTCYDGNTTNCAGASLTIPLSQRAITTQLGTSTSEHVYSYDASGNPTETDDYDWGTGAVGPLLKKTLYVYASLNNIKSFAQTVTVQNGSGTQIGQTTYKYDDYTVHPLQTTSGVPQHTTIPGGSRGNLTSVQQWVNTTGTQLTTKTMQYYDTGTINIVWDANSHPTTYAYSSTFGQAYPTQITNALNQITKKNYEINTGVLTATQDPNDVANNRAGTTYSYDNMLRVTQTNYPDGGQTAVCYTDTGGTCTKAGPPFSMVSTKKITSSISLVTTSVTDSQGRVGQTQVNSDPGGVDYTDTTYDSLGRVFTVSNPHRSSSSPTDGTTTYKYDSMNRSVEVDDPDGSKSTMSYSGNCTTVTDEASKARKSCKDGLGRVSRVWEDPAGLNYQTSYSYDALGNMLSVVENGSRQRSFVFDSLSRLTQATNPESGSVNSTYDSNSNLLTTVDARGITINYSPSDVPIDALNRVRKKTYSNGDPSVTYTYDGSSCLGQASCSNIGHRTGMTDAAGSESWSYDSMGRVAIDQRITHGVTKTFTYSTASAPYNFDGSIAQLNYPSGRIVTYTTNAAGQSVSAVDTANGVNYATLAAYTPNGTLGSLLNGANILSTLYYNDRLQLCRIAVNSSGTAPGTCADSSHTGNVLDLSYGFNLGTADNGSASAITNNLTKNNPSTDRTQNFTYDVLNRVGTAATVSTSGTTCWGEQYGYDAWGNLLSISGISPTYNGCTQESGLNLSVNTNNLITTSGYSYDNSGNLVVAPPTGTAYTFNGENQMTQAVSSTTTGYLYDGDGKRVEKTSGATPYKLYWYGMNPDALVESDGSGNITDEYIFFYGKRIARRLGP